MNNRTEPILYIVIPCYNEQEVLPITAPMFLQKLTDLTAAGKISPDSRVLFVNDGSKDRTWEIINELAARDAHYVGICQSRNRGHQNAVLAGLMEALHSGSCDSCWASSSSAFRRCHAGWLWSSSAATDTSGVG